MHQTIKKLANKCLPRNLHDSRVSHVSCSHQAAVAVKLHPRSPVRKSHKLNKITVQIIFNLLLHSFTHASSHLCKLRTAAASHIMSIIGRPGSLPAADVNFTHSDSAQS
jgi:hypothetical protein